jgi:hypothetical protein
MRACLKWGQASWPEGPKVAARNGECPLFKQALRSAICRWSTREHVHWPTFIGRGSKCNPLETRGFWNRELCATPLIDHTALGNELIDRVCQRQMASSLANDADFVRTPI